MGNSGSIAALNSGLTDPSDFILSHMSCVSSTGHCVLLSLAVPHKVRLNQDTTVDPGMMETSERWRLLPELSKKRDSLFNMSSTRWR